MNFLEKFLKKSLKQMVCKDKNLLISGEIVKERGSIRPIFGLTISAIIKFCITFEFY